MCGALEANIGDRGRPERRVAVRAPVHARTWVQSSRATAPKTVVLLKCDGERQEGLLHGLIEKADNYSGDPPGLHIFRVGESASRQTSSMSCSNSSEKQLARPAPALGELRQGRDRKSAKRRSPNVGQRDHPQIRSQTCIFCDPLGVLND